MSQAIPSSGDDIVSRDLMKPSRLRMLALAGLAAAVSAGATSLPARDVHAVALDGSGKTMPRPAIVMLWATWCASCADEVRRVPALSDAAGPLPFVTLAIDPADKARAALPRTGLPLARAFADGRPPGDVLADWGGKGAILPLAIAIDRQGRVCGRKRGLLGTDQIKQWSRSCSR